MASPVNHAAVTVEVGANMSSSSEQIDRCNGPRSDDSRISTLLKTVKKRPDVLLIPVLLFVAIVGFGCWGVMAGRQLYIEQAKQSASHEASATLSSIVQILQISYTPMLALREKIITNPYFPALYADWTNITRRLLSDANEDSGLISLQVAPYGIISTVYPLNLLGPSLGLDLLWQYPYQLEKEMIWGGLGWEGPFFIHQGNWTMMASLPIFVVSNYSSGEPDSSWGGPPTNGTCNISQCKANGTKWWGTIYAPVLLDSLLQEPTLVNLKSHGWAAKLTRVMPQGYSTPDPVLFNIGGVNDLLDPVSVILDLGQGHNPEQSQLLLKLSLSPSSGSWAGGWWIGALVGVIALGLCSSILLFLHLSSCVRLAILNQELGTANERLEQTNASLEELTQTLKTEKESTVELLKRQYKLLQVLGGDLKESMTRQDSEDRQLSEVQNHIVAFRQRHFESMAKEGDDFIITKVLGEGGNGKVYCGVWKGTEVAIKSILLPSDMSGKARERMACMEAAISSSLSHPNIVQTFTYDILAIKESQSGLNTASVAKNSLTEEGDDKVVRSYEVRIILELCDLGSLRAFLDGRIFSPPGQEPKTLAIMDTAIDVSRAVSHLHSHQVIHGDLKSSNILLKRSATDPRGFIAKVSDFGLSQQINTSQTHMSNFYQGTLTHMSPELLLRGQVSFSSDIFAFGIFLWELVTSSEPFEGQPTVTLGHSIAVLGSRPTWPGGDISSSHQALQSLAVRCWAADPADRPGSMESVLNELVEIRKKMGGKTPAIDVSKYSRILDERTAHI